MLVTIEEYDFRKAFETEKNVMIFFGFYPILEEKLFSWKNLKAFLGIVVTILQNLAMLLQVYFGHFSDVIDSCAYCILSNTFFFKLCVYLVTRNLVIKMEETLENPIFYDFPKSILKSIESQINFTKTFGKCYRATVPSYILVLTLTVFIQGSKRELPLASWLPFEYKDILTYYLISIFQIVSVGIGGYNNSSMDIMCYLFLTITSCQFEILMYNLRKIDYKASESSIKKDLERCIKHQVEILRFFEMVNKMYTYIVFIQCAGSCLVICLIGIQMLIIPLASLQFAEIMVLTLAMLCQVTFYCWQGQNILIKSGEVRDACYNTNWYHSNTSIKKMLFIIMERSKKPVTFTAGGFFILSLTTLTMILKSSYSYFAVLQHMYNE